jgi:hypothetical protein
LKQYLWLFDAEDMEGSGAIDEESDLEGFAWVEL